MDSGEKTPRIIELDGIRGLAALLVVYCHLFLTWMPGAPAPVFWLRTFSGLAWTGVHLFFILSGYLIGGILLRQRSSANYFSAFYSRRAFRILPLYFFVLAVFFLLRWFGTSFDPAVFESAKIPLWTYPLLVQNFPMSVTCDWGAPPLGVTWSVALEEQFYLFLPLLIWLLPPRFQFGGFLGIAALGPVFRAVAPVCHAPFLLPGSFEPLFTGVILAWISIHRPGLFAARKSRWIALLVFILGGCGMGAVAIGKLHPGPFDISMIAGFWAAFLWLTLAYLKTPLTRPLRWAPLRWVGGISYGVYLFHPLVSSLLFARIGGPPTHEHNLLGFLLGCFSFSVTLAISAASFYLVERRLIGIGHRFRYRPAAGA